MPFKGARVLFVTGICALGPQPGMRQYQQLQHHKRQKAKPHSRLLKYTGHNKYRLICRY